MADSTKSTSKSTTAKTTEAPETGKTTGDTADNDTNTGTPSAEAYASADLNVAEGAGISEGDVKALRDEAGLNQSAGHEMDIHAWATTEAGKQFAKSEKDRQKAAEDEEKSYKDALSGDDNLNAAEKAYREAVDKA
jgi:hypothetical protein